ncbi:b(o/a)3-type cytochrome-c oxidase subunit 1 [Ammoniphilus sp. CFH 90114]|uniref:b(o/a)3-type cytochrome-c oxidase subunit 1 n=1 Tax=Ammoniphilus sp. CFH 90114 TaxID=2493665 RepID=UPI001F0C1FE3|nr:b(o/a)3-type cytochrome-c oxidase subunit 1 [Ammoniphilus sp. CFH 90114]
MNDAVRVDPRDARLCMANLYVAFIALALGGIAGLLQVLIRSGSFILPTWLNYYQVLTLHGVLLALILTTFFIIALFFGAMSRTMGPFSNGTRLWGWVAFWMMTAGTAMAGTLMLLNKASVLYTFYAPLQAHTGFYIGLALVIVGSWIAGYCMFYHYAKWKKENKAKFGPLLGFMAVITMLMWQVATLGVATAVIFYFIPWSLGLVERIDVLITRTLFWFFGHPLVYFWLLPAYAVWYVIVPKIIGGKVFSDSLARLSFILFLLFSIPVGFHHQLMEPGISHNWKYLQVILTFAVVVPSLMTAFTMFATFEMYGRTQGATGVFGWFKKLPWRDARFLAPFLGMLMFIPGGAGGIVNASHQLNQAIHNTIWVPGHFHLTIATTVILTFFGVTFWLVPHLTGRVFTRNMNQMGLIMTVTWVVGMFFMSGAMHLAGLLGAPRRSSFSTYGDAPQAFEWIPYQIAQAVGGVLLFIAIILMLIIFINLAFLSPKGETEFPVGEVADKTERTPVVFENWYLWLGVLAFLIFVAYTYPVMHMIHNAPIGAKGYILW